MVVDGNVCKGLDEPISLIEKHVLYSCLKRTPGSVEPSVYFHHIIQAMYYAMTGNGESGITPLVGFLTQLGQIHPDYYHAVNCLVNGNLISRHFHQVTKVAKRQVEQPENL